MTSPRPDKSKNKIISAERSNSTRLRRLSSCRLSRLIFLHLTGETIQEMRSQHATHLAAWDSNRDMTN